MKKMFIGGAAVAAILAGSAAFAQAVQPASAAPRGHHARALKPATRAEVESHVAAAFAKLDSNHDGAITEDELNARKERREKRAEQRAERFDPSKLFDRLDSNHDGKITAAEAEAARSQHAKARPGKPAAAQATAVGGLFDRADGDKDGVVTRAEFDTIGQRVKSRIEHAGMRRAGKGARMFDTADSNGDGRVSLGEMQQAALSRFDRADLNHDGTITPQERQERRQNLKAKRKPG
jgi:Ca2+-binding EF-hand superfamily protein